MNKLVAIFTLCGVVSIGGLFANSIDIESVNPKSSTAQTLSQNDIEFLFGTSSTGNLNMRVLSKEELEETKGMWAQFVYGVAGGFVLGFGKYAAYTYEDWIADPYATFDWNGAFDAGIECAMDGLILGGIWKGGSILKGF